MEARERRVVDATRDLLGPPQTPLATRAQGFAPCRAAPTVACLLDDALADGLVAVLGAIGFPVP